MLDRRQKQIRLSMMQEQQMSLQNDERQAHLFVMCEMTVAEVCPRCSCQHRPEAASICFSPYFGQQEA